MASEEGVMEVERMMGEDQNASLSDCSSQPVDLTSNPAIYRAVDCFAETPADYPGPRCGHTLTAVTAIRKDTAHVGTRLILFGGATALEGSSGLPPSPSVNPGIRLAEVTAEVHCFDTSTNHWKRIQPAGVPPSPRAAHAATAVGTMVVLQGGIGPAGLSSEDLHVLDLSQSEATWHRVLVKGPGPRYGHNMGLVQQRYLLLACGNDGVRLLSDVWVLDTATKPYAWRKVEAEGEGPPPCMYAAASTRMDGVFVISGGRDSSGVPLNSAYRLASTEGGGWRWGIIPPVIPPSPRYQHAAAFVGARFHVSGGASGRGHIVDDTSSFAVLDSVSDMWYDRKTIISTRSGHTESDELTKRCRHAAAAVGSCIYIYGGLKAGVLFEDLLVADDSFMELRGASRTSSENLKSLEQASAEEAEAISALMAKARHQSDELLSHASDDDVATPSSSSSDSSISPSSNVRLHHKAVVASETGGILGSLVRQLSLDRFENEGRRVSSAKKLVDRQMTIMHGVHKKVLTQLLRPRGWKASMTRKFFLDFNEILELCEAAEQIFASEPNVLKLKAPVKIFGDLHGQFGDLMRLFDEYGAPSTAGDISYIDYLFLGDYVDRGQHSLETILLLLALKIEHPLHVHMIRGNHEAADINALFGFRTECIERMGEWEGLWAWHRINQLFNWLPLAALIEKKIICMHGGIGRSINNIEQIEQLKRPITMDTGSVVLMDLLWSDPTENDSVQGIQPNARGPGLVTFGPDRVMEFCRKNDVQLIIRAHECVMDGFERFAQGQLITLFSATNYCGSANNAGAILVLGRDLVVVPKLIHPLPPFHDENANGEATWMEELNVQRPPTPTRGRPSSAAERGSLAYI